MENIIRISVSEAARLFGVSTKTIRQAIKSEELRYIVVNGRYKISFISLVEWSQKSTRRSNLLKDQGMGQYVDKWKISNKKYSPNPKLALQNKKDKVNNEDRESNLDQNEQKISS
ncbi:helix-turn-helix domain-containing protein [Candidatus Parcubacteria bacterium]|jgi:excisionase family DNA binding protein|nr:helix-turn-helix domain-containing protein [Candidatus Parcubacteria bacterium]